jgi:superfamily II DNA/RNA helicase
MLGFRQKKFPILVATDVVSRGIDIDSIELVVNYDVPPNEEDYVHRIGRTARADKDGEGVTLINPDDQYRFGKIEKLIEKEVPKLDIPERLGKGPEYNPKNRGGGGRHGGRSGGHGGRGGRKPFRGGGGGNSSGGGGNRGKKPFNRNKPKQGS